MSPERPGWSEKKPKETTVLNVEDAPRLLIPALDESNRFFAKDIASLEIPDAFYRTEERLREIGFTRAEPLVLPQRTLLEDDPMWKGKVKPEQWFWRWIQNGNIKPESAILQNGVYLIDGRAKPIYEKGQQRYEDDEFMGDLIKGLRRKGYVQKHSHIPDGSRFGASPEEIEEVILPEFARAIGKDALSSEGRVVINPYKVFNIVGNMRHYEWGKTNTMEWFGDKFGSVRTLVGGYSGFGGLAYVGNDSSNCRDDGVGFRPLIFFSSKS
jgi:hypothetical protein